jgi:hypothetical protein
MINLNNLDKQHERIKGEVSFFEEEIKKGIPDRNTSQLALHVNILAGQLKVHLLEEDEFLYPDLLKSSDPEIQRMAKQYFDEMGNLVSEYNKFKQNYNINIKIEKNKEMFNKDVQIIIKALKDRINKEDNELYQLIKTKRL